MSASPVVLAGDETGRADFVINDFSIQIATVNGSGSQTANNVLMRSIFQMGVPVSGKNLFPSNIAGLPTWFTIRANPKGYIGRKKEFDFLVAMNAETAREDVEKLQSGGAAVYDEPLGLQLRCATTCTFILCRSTNWWARSARRPSSASWSGT